jgi:hypothetical protein
MTEIKLGKIYYHIFTDETTGKVEVVEYHVITVRGKYAYAVWKNVFTYGKRSKKNGDFGWLRPIGPEWRTRLSRFQTDDWFNISPKSHSLFPTKLSALKDEFASQTEDNFDSHEIFEKAMRTLKSMITKERGKKKNASV